MQECVDRRVREGPGFACVESLLRKVQVSYESYKLIGPLSVRGMLGKMINVSRSARGFRARDVGSL